MCKRKYKKDSRAYHFRNSNKWILKREEIKNFMKSMGKDFDYFEETVFSAIKRSELEGWGEMNEFLRTGKQ